MKGADLVFRTVELIDKGNVETFAQDDSLASPAPKITKEICKIFHCSKKSVKLANLFY